PISIFPMVLIETLPPAPSEAEIREHVNQQARHSLKGEKSDLRLSPHYLWTNIVIESLAVPTNYASSYPYRADMVLLAQGLDSKTLAPLQFRLRMDIRYMDYDNWLVLPTQAAQ